MIIHRGKGECVNTAAADQADISVNKLKKKYKETILNRQFQLLMSTLTARRSFSDENG